MRLAALFLLISLCAACGDDTATSPSPTDASRATERFDDIINVRESKFKAFSVGSGGTTSINLASLSPIAGSAVINATMEIGWGKTIKDDSGNPIGCELAKVLQTAPALASQMNEPLPPGQDYCAKIADVGGLRNSANFSMRITHP